ncbi:T9SS type A sorting domain-containing protein [Chryseobacterium sp. cx-311]|uniref:T9SS type A sorting domain-containing protein n=1 Tax=Marnyiella aurantia TaxID=2758037 RepID=UPI001AE5CB5E|nr:T9SS type A sorting domain-containing protein [Marnyiella aurantia]MBP0612364.1 T9SS type A sorting domain-containing protein [Marnyiella aurantia]
MKRILTTILLIILSIQIHSQEYQWIRTFGDVFADHASDVKTDSFGNIYLIGHFSHYPKFKPMEMGSVSLVETGVENGNLFGAKFNPNGQLIWAKNLGGTASNSNVMQNREINEPKIILDPIGNLIVFARYDQGVDLDPGPNTYIIPPDSNYTRSWVMSKYDANGNFLSAKNFGGVGDIAIIINNVKTDAAGNIYLAGMFRGTIDVDMSSNVYNITADQQYLDSFFMKMDSNANFIWVKHIENSGVDDRVLDIAVNNQYLYMTGDFSGNVDFNTGTAVNILQSNNSSKDAFLAKYSLLDGSYQWAVALGGNYNNDVGRTIETDELDNVYTTGVFRGSVDFDPSPMAAYILEPSSFVNNVTDLYVLKLDGAGNFGWVKTFFSSDGTYYHSKQDRDLVLKNDNLFFTGNYIRQLRDRNNQPITNLSQSSNSNEIFIMRLNKIDGTVLGVKSIVGNQDEYGYAIHFDNANNMVLAGAFTGDIQDPFVANSLMTTGNGNTDAFVMKWNLDILLSTNDFNSVSTELKLSPNPASESINLNSDTELTKFKIFSTDGKLVYDKSLRGKSVNIDIRHLPAGVYLVQVINIENESQTIKFIKQ